MRLSKPWQKKKGDWKGRMINLTYFDSNVFYYIKSSSTLVEYRNTDVGPTYCVHTLT